MFKQRRVDRRAQAYASHAIIMPLIPSKPSAVTRFGRRRRSWPPRPARRARQQGLIQRLSVKLVVEVLGVRAGDRVISRPHQPPPDFHLQDHSTAQAQPSINDNGTRCPVPIEERLTGRLEGAPWNPSPGARITSMSGRPGPSAAKEHVPPRQRQRCLASVAAPTAQAKADFEGTDPGQSRWPRIASVSPAGRSADVAARLGLGCQARWPGQVGRRPRCRAGLCKP